MNEVQKRYPEVAVVYDGSVTGPSFRPEVAIIQDRTKSYQAKTSELEGYLVQSPSNREVIKNCDVEGLSRGRLLVDQIARKIYIDGERVSSKEIFSQQLTIDLLDGYINKGQTEFAARDLGSSSYTQNKSEMMSKILHPLMRTIHRRLGRNLRISCSGSTLDFVIKFEEVDLELCSVSRIGGGVIGKKR
jgi:chromosome condensin MukBEF MukE localization factor